MIALLLSLLAAVWTPIEATPQWHPRVRVIGDIWWNECWNYRTVYYPDGRNVLEPMDCESGGPTVYVDDAPYPTPTREVVK